jgi:hypothetical protein
MPLDTVDCGIGQALLSCRYVPPMATAAVRMSGTAAGDLEAADALILAPA